MIRVCITLAVFLAASIFSMADMEIRSQIYQTVQSNGSWQAAFTGLTEEQEKLVRARAEVERRRPAGKRGGGDVRMYGRWDERRCVRGG